MPLRWSRRSTHVLHAQGRGGSFLKERLVGDDERHVGTPVTMENGQLKVPNDPVIHYIEVTASVLTSPP